MPRSGTSSRAERTETGPHSPGPDAVLSVEIAPPGLRAREVKSRSKTRASGAHPSFRMKRMIHWESEGERNESPRVPRRPVGLSQTVAA